MKNEMITVTPEVLDKAMRRILGEDAYRQICAIREFKAIAASPVKVFQLYPGRVSK